jgi:hypothetical protein
MIEVYYPEIHRHCQMVSALEADVRELASEDLGSQFADTELTDRRPGGSSWSRFEDRAIRHSWSSQRLDLTFASTSQPFRFRENRLGSDQGQHVASLVGCAQYHLTQQ